MKVSLGMKWKDFKTPEQWREWLVLAAQKSPEMHSIWSDTSACNGCRHLDTINSWCLLCEAPATRNPVLNMLGMACCGAAFETPGQQELFNEPF